MFNRRKLFGFAAAAPFMTAAALTSKAKADNAPKQDIMRLTQGNSEARMYLTAKPVDELPAEIGLAIGSDGYLWIRSHNEWKRVATE